MFFPKPAIAVYLYESIPVLYSRKPDHPKGDLERQEKLFEEILGSMKNVVRVRSQSDVDLTLDGVSESVFSFLVSK